MPGRPAASKRSTVARRRSFRVDAGPVPDVDEVRGLSWSPENKAFFDRARPGRRGRAGFRETARLDLWDPPKPPEFLPSRAWCAGFYARHRERFTSRFVDGWRSRGWAWPIAEFDESPELRRQAEVALAEQDARVRRLRREVAADNLRRQGEAREPTAAEVDQADVRRLLEG